MEDDGFVATAPSLVYVETAEDRAEPPSLVYEASLDDYTKVRASLKIGGRVRRSLGVQRLL